MPLVPTGSKFPDSFTFKTKFSSCVHGKVLLWESPGQDRDSNIAPTRASDTGWAAGKPAHTSRRQVCAPRGDGGRGVRPRNQRRAGLAPS